MCDNKEEKFDPLPVEEDDTRNKFSLTRAKMWYNISSRTYLYMMRSYVNDDWLGTRSFYSNPDHERHGFALRAIEMSESFDSKRSRYRNEQWNRF